MKRILALVLTIVMLFSMVACNQSKDSDPKETTVENIISEGTTPEETTPEVTTPKPEVTTPEPEVTTPEPEVTTPEDTTVTYKVIVVDENNVPLAGAMVQLCTGSVCGFPSATNADGVATFKLNKADYTAKVTLEGYIGDAEYHFAANSTELKVQLTKNASETTPEPEVTTPEDATVTYKVIVVDESNAPLAGAIVQLCVGDICRLPSVTDADGVATFAFDKADYTVKVTLEGYIGDAEYHFDANSTELKVQLTKNASETTPDVDDPITPEFEVALPEVSKLIANIIGALSATLEVSEDSQFVYVVESSYEISGSKQVLFVEVAEASVDSDGELLKAQLKLKVGLTETTLTGLVPSKEVVVDKENAEYYELSVSVNGDDVSFSMNGQNASQNLSDVFYGTIAQMLGVGDVEGLKNMLKTAYIAQELEKKLMPIIEQAFGAVVEELPTISPAYIEHLAELFALLGEESITVTTDDVTGNITYSWNIAALKNLITEVEGKTLAEYLETVYGENVVAALASFLKSVPDKTVKDIVDVAVTFAEQADVEIKDIYELIDLYVYSVTGTEFSIEEQINENYNKTLAELLVDYNDIEPEEEAAFIAGMKESFANAADTIQTVSIDALLSSMFMNTNEGFLDALKETIDMFDEKIVYNYTTNAEGYLVAIHYGIADLQYDLVVEGDDTILTITLPNGFVFNATVNEKGLNFVVENNGKQVGAGSITATEEIVVEDVVTTVVVDLRDDENDLLDYTSVSVNGVITELDIVVRDYNTEYDSYYNPETDEFIENYEEELVEILTVEYKDLTSDSESVITTIFNATIKEYSSWGMGHNDPATGEYSETWVEEYREWITIEYSDFSDGGLLLNLFFGEYVAPIGSVNISVTEETIDEDVVTTVVVDLRDDENDLLDYTSVSVNGVTTTFNAVVRGYDVWYESFYDHETDEYFEIRHEEFVEFFAIEYNDLGEDGQVLTLLSMGNTIQITQKDNELTLDVIEGDETIANAVLSVTETGVKFVVYDENGETVELFEIIENDESIVLNAFVGMSGEELLDAVVTFTVAEGEFTIDVDLDHLSMGDSYIELDGAIKLKVA